MAKPKARLPLKYRQLEAVARGEVDDVGECLRILSAAVSSIRSDLAGAKARRRKATSASTFTYTQSLRTADAGWPAAFPQFLFCVK